MNNLAQIIVIAAWLSVPLSIWGILYFLARIITQNKIRRDLGSMPSAEELSQWYEQNNLIITYGQHSPTRKKSAIVKKSTL